MLHQQSLFHDTAPTLDEIMGAWKFGEYEWKSRAMIAQKIGRAKSPALITLLGVAVGMGFLDLKNEILPNRVNYFLYRPTLQWFDGTMTLPY